MRLSSSQAPRLAAWLVTQARDAIMSLVVLAHKGLAGLAKGV